MITPPEIRKEEVCRSAAGYLTLSGIGSTMGMDCGSCETRGTPPQGRQPGKT